MNSAAAVIFLCCAILLSALFQKIRAFSVFTEGALEGLRSAVRILPSLIGLMAMVEVFKASGLVQLLSDWLAPITARLGIPVELLPLILLRPISGSGSLSFYKGLLTQFGADSLIGRLGGVIQGCGETVFYVASLYFGSIGSQKSGTAIFCAIIGNLAGICTAVWIIEKIF